MLAMGDMEMEEMIGPSTNPCGTPVIQLAMQSESGQTGWSQRDKSETMPEQYRKCRSWFVIY